MNDNMKIKYFDEELEVYDERRVVNKNTYSITLNYVPSPTRPLTVENGKTMLTETNGTPNTNQYVLDRENGLLLFNQAMKGKVMTINYSAIGLWCISADKVYTNVDNKGKIVETLEDLMKENRQAIESIKTVGDASTVITQLQANIDSVTGLVGNIAEGSSVNEELTKSITSGKGTNTTLTNTISSANNKINEMNAWVNQHGDIVNLDNRVDTVETEIPKINEQLIKNATELKLTPKTENKPTTQGIWQEFEDRAINVKWFGAVGNAKYFDEATKKFYADAKHTIPATDDTEAIRKAIASAYQQHIPIFFPRGQYYISDTITIPNYMYIVGVGTVQGSAIVTDKAIDMLKTEEKGLYIQIEKIAIRGVKNHTLSGLTVKSSLYSSFLNMTDCLMENFKNYCAELQGFAGGFIFDSVLACGGEYGLKIINASNSKIDNLIITDCGTNLYCEGGSGLKVYNAYLTTEPENIGKEGVTPTTRFAHLVNTTSFKFYDCKFETVTNDLIEHVLLETDNDKIFNDRQMVDNEFYKCQWLSLNKKGHNITISSKPNTLREPRRTRITEPEFLTPISNQNYYDINIESGTELLITRGITKESYSDGLLKNPLINNPNGKSYTMFSYKGEETGTNSNGYYTKFPNGTLITITEKLLDCTTTSLQTARTPHSFLLGSSKSLSVSTDITNIDALNEIYDVRVGMTDATSNTILIRKKEAGSNVALPIRITTIGRWK